MAGLIKYLTCIEYMWRYKLLDIYLHNKEFELCISLLTGHATWAFCLMIRNKLIVHCKELKFSIESAMPLKMNIKS
jgi:hypothetical protein